MGVDDDVVGARGDVDEQGRGDALGVVVAAELAVRVTATRAHVDHGVEAGLGEVGGHVERGRLGDVDGVDRLRAGAAAAGADELVGGVGHGRAFGDTVGGQGRELDIAADTGVGVELVVVSGAVAAGIVVSGATVVGEAIAVVIYAVGAGRTVGAVGTVVALVVLQGEKAARVVGVVGATIAVVVDAVVALGLAGIVFVVVFGRHAARVVGVVTEAVAVVVDAI